MNKFFYGAFIFCSLLLSHCNKQDDEEVVISILCDDGDWTKNPYYYTVMKLTLDGDTLSSFPVYDHDCRFTLEGSVIASSWDKENSVFSIHLFRDGEKTDHLVFDECSLTPLSTNSPRYIAILSTDFEQHLEDDSIRFVIYDVVEKEEIPLLIVNDSIEMCSLEDPVKFVFFDLEPRGEGELKHTQKLRVVNLLTRKVSDCYTAESVDDLFYEKGEECLNQFGHFHWLDNDKLSYMTYQRQTETDDFSLVRIYTFDTKQQKTRKEYEVSINIDEIDYMIFNKTLFLKNRTGVYIKQKKGLKRLIQTNNKIIDFYVSTRR